MVLALIKNGPEIVSEVKDLLSSSNIENKDELIAQITEAQGKWPEWT
jgi:hypothetical protein